MTTETGLVGLGSVVRYWPLDLTAQNLSDPTDLATIAPVVDDWGEGRWAVQRSEEDD